LKDFIDSGPRPVVLTLGSMAMVDPATLSETYDAALAATGQRGILLGHPSPAASTQRLLHLRGVSYDWLFPHAAVVIHHGGVGTLASVLHAGVPSVVVPQILAQQHVAAMLLRERLAPSALRAITLDTLEPAIQAATRDTAIQSAAARWRSIIAADEGVTHAVRLIESHWGRMARP
jgi:UDP:flavonoid glycosyltransferase YjiC (YdhE family)